MAKRLIERARGFVHDIQSVASLSDVANNARLLSDRSLYILQNLSGEDVTFLSRYGDILTEGYYDPVEEGSSEAETVYDAINLIRRDLNDMAVEQWLECMCEQLQSIAGSISAAQTGDCACNIGSNVETTDGEEGGPLPDPVNGVPYEAADPIVNRKCKASNYIHKGVKDVVNELKLSRADSYGFAGLSFVLGLVATIVGAFFLGPFGLLLGAVAGAFLAMATMLLNASFSLTLLYTAITADEDGAVCALYFATSASEARDDYLAHLQAEGATAPELLFVGYLLTNNLLNLLFFAWGDSEAVIDITPIIHDCTCECEFDFVWGTGTPTYDGVEFVLSSEDVGGGFYSIKLLVPCNGGCAGNWCAEFTATTIDLNPGDTWTRRVRNIKDVACGASPWSDFAWPASPAFPPLDDPVLMSEFQFTDDSPFTVSMKIKASFRGLGDGTAPYSGSNDCV